LGSRDAALAGAAAAVAAKHRDWMPAVTARFDAELKQGNLSSNSLALLEIAVKPWFAETCVRDLVSTLAGSNEATQQRTAWRILASAGGAAPEPRCTASLIRSLSNTPLSDLPLLLEAM